MSIYNRNFSVKLSWLILGASAALIAVFVWISFSLTQKTAFAEEGPVWLFAVGLVPGLAVALVQFILSWVEFNEIDRFRKLGVKNVLLSRDEEAYYRKMVEDAKRNITVLGATGSRFVRDFADEQSQRDDKKVLIKALTRGVRVRLLVAEDKYLSPKDAGSYTFAKPLFINLKNKFPNFEVRYFLSVPIASFVQVDGDFVVGPIFPNIASQHSPALHTTSQSQYAQSYLAHFEDEWQKAIPL